MPTSLWWWSGFVASIASSAPGRSSEIAGKAEAESGARLAAARRASRARFIAAPGLGSTQRMLAHLSHTWHRYLSRTRSPCLFLPELFAPGGGVQVAVAALQDSRRQEDPRGGGEQPDDPGAGEAGEEQRDALVTHAHDRERQEDQEAHAGGGEKGEPRLGLGKAHQDSPDSSLHVRAPTLQAGSGKVLRLVSAGHRQPCSWRRIVLLAGGGDRPGGAGFQTGFREWAHSLRVPLPEALRCSITPSLTIPPPFPKPRPSSPSCPPSAWWAWATWAFPSPSRSARSARPWATTCRPRRCAT